MNTGFWCSLKCFNNFHVNYLHLRTLITILISFLNSKIYLIICFDSFWLVYSRFSWSILIWSIIFSYFYQFLYVLAVDHLNCSIMFSAWYICYLSWVYSTRSVTVHWNVFDLIKIRKYINTCNKIHLLLHLSIKV